MASSAAPSLGSAVAAWPESRQQHLRREGPQAPPLLASAPHGARLPRSRRVGTRLAPRRVRVRPARGLERPGHDHLAAASRPPAGARPSRPGAEQDPRGPSRSADSPRGAVGRLRPWGRPPRGLAERGFGADGERDQGHDSGPRAAGPSSRQGLRADLQDDRSRPRRLDRGHRERRLDPRGRRRRASHRAPAARGAPHPVGRQHRRLPRPLGRREHPGLRPEDERHGGQAPPRAHALRRRERQGRRLAEHRDRPGGPRRLRHERPRHHPARGPLLHAFPRRGARFPITTR